MPKTGYVSEANDIRKRGCSALIIRREYLSTFIILPVAPSTGPLMSEWKNCEPRYLQIWCAIAENVACADYFPPLFVVGGIYIARGGGNHTEYDTAIL